MVMVAISALFGIHELLIFGRFSVFILILQKTSTSMFAVCHDTEISPIWVCRLSWLMILLSWFLFTPIILYYTYKFYQNRFHPGIRSRHPLYTGIMALICLWFNCIVIPLRYMEGSIHLFGENHIAYSGYFPYITLLFNISILTFSYAGIVRIWLLYFDIRWLHANQHKDWAHILNVNHEISFFLKRKKTFGNDTYLLKRLIALLVLLYILYAITIKIKWGIYTCHILLFMCNIPPFITLLILFFKTPTLSDIFYVRYEAKSWIFLSTFTIILSIVCGSLLIYYSKTRFEIYIEFVLTTSFYILTIGIPVSSLYLVLKYVVYNGEQCECDLTHLKYRFSISTNRSSISTNHHFRYTPNQSLLALLSHSQGINAFMVHLKHEYAIENLLAFIELFQFIQIMEKYFDIPDSASTLNHIILANNVPTSQINLAINASNWRKRLSLIYEKYIIGEYELNLSFELRNSFIFLICKELKTNSNDIDLIKFKVFPILFSVIDETIRLLNDSLRRFRKTKEYKKFEMVFNDKSNTNITPISRNNNNNNKIQKRLTLLINSFSLNRIDELQIDRSMPQLQKTPESAAGGRHVVSASAIPLRLQVSGFASSPTLNVNMNAKIGRHSLSPLSINIHNHPNHDHNVTDEDEDEDEEDEDDDMGLVILEDLDDLSRYPHSFKL